MSTTEETEKWLNDLYLDYDDGDSTEGMWAMRDIIHEASERLRAKCTEVDRLTRVLAVERGCEQQAPDGWTFDPHCGWVGAHDVVQRAQIHCWSRLDEEVNYPSALEAMEAADAAREASDGKA